MGGMRRRRAEGALAEPPPRLVHGLQVGAVVEEQLEGLDGPAHRREVQRRDVELPPGLDVGVPLDEQLGHGQVAVVHGHVEARVALLRCGEDTGEAAR